jgi:hypothetical protein
MIAAQAMAMHHASMECSRRAMLPDQPFEAAQGFRKAGANASRTFIELRGAGAGSAVMFRSRPAIEQPAVPEEPSSIAAWSMRLLDQLASAAS